MKKIGMKDLPVEERPRERLMRLGQKRLSNSELLSIVLGVGSRDESALGLAGRLLASHDIERLSRLGVAELRRVLGVKDAKACAVVAAFELGRRARACKKSVSPVKSPETIARLFSSELADPNKEALMCICVDSKMNVLKHEVVSVGGLNANSVHPRDVFRTAVTEAAAGVVLAHNHPSGDPTPSRTDVKFTARVKAAGSLLGVELLDHVIVGGEKYVSFKESGLL